MSVFTPVTEAQLAGWLKRYSVGSLRLLEPIAAGIENTNYFVTTSQNGYVLTLFEKLSASELPFYLNLMAHLARHGIACPAPIADLADRYLGELNGKPAALVTRLPGKSVQRPGREECAQLGALLARMHLAGRSYPEFLDNPRGPRWWRETAPQVRPFLDMQCQALLDAEIVFQRLHRFAELPRGPVHGDLFRDNALFDCGRLSGVFDYYFAGVDVLLFDVAVCANDWCLVDPDGNRELDVTLLRVLLREYAAIRPFTPAECEAWPTLLRAAALRFWLSRLYDFHLPRPGELVHAHDPEHFRQILASRARPGFAAPWLA
ncbi:MAG: homoserine kinase [Betaproteobacteria bacterium]|nr:homoserine kinase [Betaproteobacteria bacterium]